MTQLDNITIDPARAMTLLVEAVAENGEDFIYTPEASVCYYARDGKPSCVVGVALAKAGVTVAELEAMDEDEAGLGCIESVGLPDRLELLPGVRSIFAAAQSYQDNGATWGKALDEARFEADCQGVALAA